MAKGLVMIYTGSGNKALPVVGQIFRALGRGFRVCVITFGESDFPYADMLAPEKFGDLLEIHKLDLSTGIGETPRDRAKEVMRQAWKSARSLMESGRFDMVALDELPLLMAYDAVSAVEIADYLGECREKFCVLATAATLLEPLASVADLITEVSEIGSAGYHSSGPLLSDTA